MESGKSYDSPVKADDLVDCDVGGSIETNIVKVEKMASSEASGCSPWSSEADDSEEEDEVSTVNSEFVSKGLHGTLKYSKVVQKSLMYCPIECCAFPLFGFDLKKHEKACHQNAPCVFPCFICQLAFSYKVFTKVGLMEHLASGDHGLSVYCNGFGGVLHKLDDLKSTPDYKPIFALVYDDTFFVAMYKRQQVLFRKDIKIIFKIFQCSILGSDLKKYKAKITFCGDEGFFSSDVNPVNKLNNARSAYEILSPTNCLILPENVEFYGSTSLQALLFKV